MLGLKKLGAVYLIGVAVAVAVYFIVNPLLTDAIDVPAVWQVLDVLMVVALAIALAYNYARKREECGGDPGGAVTTAWTATTKPGSSGPQWTWPCRSSWASLAAASGGRPRRARTSEGGVQAPHIKARRHSGVTASPQRRLWRLLAHAVEHHRVVAGDLPEVRRR